MCGMSAQDPTVPVSGAGHFPLPGASLETDLGPCSEMQTSHLTGEISRSLSPSAETPKGREEANFSHEANNDDTRDCGWRACSEGTAGLPGRLAVNHAAPASRHVTGWRGAVSGGAEAGRGMQECRECQGLVLTLCCP